MISKNVLTAGILSAGLLLGCGGGDAEHFVRFEIEDQSYSVDDPTFMVTRIKDDLHMMDFTHSRMSSIPGATIQWRMNLDSMEELAGRNLDLNAVDPTDAGPLVLFTLTQDLTAHSQQHSTMNFKIDRIDRDTIEGSFSGKDFMYVSMTKDMTHEVDVTARFRVKFDRR